MQKNPVKIRTSPFLLMNIIWLCLDFAMNAAGDDKIIELTTQKTETGAQIRFRRLEAMAKVPLDTFPAENEQSLLDLLNANLTLDTGGGEIVLKLSENIDNESNI